MHLRFWVACLIASLFLLNPSLAWARSKPKPIKKQASVSTVVPVTVELPALAERASWPVSTGVPFARGQLKAGTSLVVRDVAHGRAEQPAQTRILARWPDGSVRWALVDWQVDPPSDALPPRQQREKAGARPAAGKSLAIFGNPPLSLGCRRRFEIVPSANALVPKRSVEVKQEKTKVVVDTGPLRFSVPIDHFAILENATLAGHSVFAGGVDGFIATDADHLTPQQPISVRVLESGPLRVRIEIRGPYDKAFEYVVRIDAYAGQPWVRVLHTFEQHADQSYLPVREIALRLPLPASKGLHYLAGVEGQKPRKGKLTNGLWRMQQVDNQTLSVRGTEQSAHARGWLDVTGDDTGFAIAAPYFWQEYPQAFTLESGRLTYDLLAAGDRPLPVGMGAAKTHELVVAMHGADHPSAEWLDLLAEPLAATVDPGWIYASGALRNSVARRSDTNAFLGEVGAALQRVEERNAVERWDDSGEVRCVGDEVPRTGAYGMFNWGDWNYPGYHDDTKGCDAWGNQEYDLTQAYALGYAALGEPKWRRAMVVAARHFMDVDVVHFQVQRSDWIGMNHPKNPLHFAFDLGGVDLGHTWTEGLLSTYFFTGDERALAAARGIADYLDKRTRRGVTLGNPRQYGWPQIALVAMYEATGEGKYRDAALWYAQRGIASHPADKLKDWKLGILAEGLAYTHSVTGNQEIRNWLEQFAKTVLEQNARDPRFFPAIAYVGRLTSNPEMAKAAQRAVGALQFGGWAKPVTIATRIGFAIYGAGRP